MSSDTGLTLRNVTCKTVSATLYVCCDSPVRVRAGHHVVLPEHGKHDTCSHTPCTAFRHLPPNSARFSYTTKGEHYLRAAVQRRGQRPPKRMAVEAT